MIQTCLDDGADATQHGLRVKVAIDDRDQAVGMIQHLPIEAAPADGVGLYMILCIWVHGCDEGIGDVQRRGIGSALLEAAEVDARDLGATGMAAWGLRIPVWTRASWFKKHGYRAADNQAGRQLVWKPFTPYACEPSWIPSKWQARQTSCTTGTLTRCSSTASLCNEELLRATGRSRRRSRNGCTALPGDRSLMDRGSMKAVG